MHIAVSRFLKNVDWKYIITTHLRYEAIQFTLSSTTHINSTSSTFPSFSASFTSLILILKPFSSSISHVLSEPHNPRTRTHLQLSRPTIRSSRTPHSPLLQNLQGATHLAWASERCGARLWPTRLVGDGWMNKSRPLQRRSLGGNSRSSCRLEWI